VASSPWGPSGRRRGCRGSPSLTLALAVAEGRRGGGASWLPHPLARPDAATGLVFAGRVIAPNRRLFRQPTVGERRSHVTSTRTFSKACRLTFPTTFCLVYADLLTTFTRLTTASRGRGIFCGLWLALRLCSGERSRALS
jgi:hypothetical protein